MTAISSASSSSITTSFNYERRMEELRQKVKFFESRLGISKTVNLSIGDFDSSPCVLTSENTVRVPSWMLFRPEDIPIHLRITEFEDHRLIDQNLLTQLAVWMNEKISEAGLTTVCCPDEYGILHKAIVLFESFELSEKAEDFLIGHEVAHLAHFLKEKNARWQEKRSIGWIILGVFYVSFSFVLLPVIFEVGLVLAAAGCAMVISGTSCYVWVALKSPSSDLSWIEKEKNADLDSVEALQDATGGIHYFSITQKFNRLLRLFESSFSDDIDMEGNDLTDRLHPLFSERIAYLNAWQSQHIQTLENRAVVQLYPSQHLQRA